MGRKEREREKEKKKNTDKNEKDERVRWSRRRSLPIPFTMMSILPADLFCCISFYISFLTQPTRRLFDGLGGKKRQLESETGSLADGFPSHFWSRHNTHKFVHIYTKTKLKIYRVFYDK